MIQQPDDRESGDSWLSRARQLAPDLDDAAAAKLATMMQQDAAIRQWKYDRNKARQEKRDATLNWTESQAWRLATFPDDMSDIADLPDNTTFHLGPDGSSGYSINNQASAVKPDQRLVSREEYVAHHQGLQSQRVAELLQQARDVRPDEFLPRHLLTDSSLPAALQSAGLKLRRAHTHLDSLHDHFRTYGQSNRVLLKETPPNAQPDSDGQIGYTVEFDGISDEIALIIGDVATNARAVLDHLVWGVCDRTDREAHKPNVKFCCVERSNTNNPGNPPSPIVRAMPGAHPNAHQIVESFQCYDVNDTQHRPDMVAVSWLNTIVNGDKHRVVTPTRSAIGQLSARCRDGSRVFAGIGGAESGDEVRLPPLHTDGNGNFAGSTSCDVSLKEIAYIAPSSFHTPGGRWPIETTTEVILMNILGYVEEVWVAFKNDPGLFT